MSIFTACNDSQATYRVLLKALTHPGKCHPFNDKANTDDHLLLQISSCLMDHEVTFAMTGQWTDITGRLIADRTGSQMTDWHMADFILINGGTSHGRAEEAQRGTLTYPDKGATLIYCIENEWMTSVAGTAQVRLSGPGIEHPFTPQLEGLEVDEYHLLRHINSDYPLGVDAFVLKDNSVMGLPRSTRIEVE
jgi:alpha-D-ribose 1-methylphosphonate 5-triphosphate synthase subunit PhnH